MSELFTPVLPKVEFVYNETQSDNLPYSLDEIANSINLRTHADTGLPLSTFYPHFGSFDFQPQHTKFGDIGNALTSTRLLKELGAIDPISASHRTHQILTTLGEVMSNPRCYRDGRFIQHLNPEGSPAENFPLADSSPESHVLFLHGLQTAAQGFPEHLEQAEELIRRMLQGGPQITLLGNYRPRLIQPSQIQSRVIPRFKPIAPTHFMQPAEIMRDLEINPEETFDRLAKLREDHPGIYIDGIGYMHGVDTQTGEVDQRQLNEDLTSILISSYNYISQMNEGGDVKQKKFASSAAELQFDIVPYPN